MALIKFYGEGCSFCHQMEPLDQKVEQELGVKIEKLEVWGNPENDKKLKSVDTLCGGVPFYLNEETKKTLCGAVDYESLKTWAQGQPVQQTEHNHNNDEHDLTHQNH